MAIRTLPPAPALPGATYADYLRRAGGTTRIEWANGEIIVPMPPKDFHQTALLFLAQLMHLFASLFRLGRVIAAPFEMRLLAGQSSREPDILFVASDHLHRLTEDRLDGPADLVVEIISDDSMRRDRHNKFRENRQAGVREYWIVDPRPGKGRIDLYTLNSDSEYELLATDDDERITSQVLPVSGLDQPGCGRPARAMPWAHSARWPA